MSTPGAGLLLADLVTRGRRVRPDAPALIDGTSTVTRAELATRVLARADALRDAGVREGARVAVLSPNAPDVLEVAFAASLVGAVVVLLNVRLAPHEIRFQIDDAGATHALVHPELEELARASGVLDLATWWVGEPARAAGAVEPWARPTPDTPWLHLYTSGTTGGPKGCIHSQRTWLAGIDHAVQAFTLRSDDRLLGAMPLFHVAGLALAMGTLAVGGAVIVAPRAADDEMLELAAAHGATVMALAGGERTVSHPLFPKVAPSLRTVLGVRSTGPELRARRAELLSHAAWRLSYGSTEMAGYVVTGDALDDCDEQERPGSSGRFLFDVETQIVDLDGREVAVGEVGELCMRGPSVMVGYHGLPDATAAALRDGWFHSGDLCRIDADGYLYVVDRLKDMVKTGGENVYCLEVENVLLGHPAVEECAVFGVPDERWGEAVKAMVVTRPGTAVTAEDLDAHCLVSLGAFKRPRWYELVDQIPRSSGGKVSKRMLRDLHDPETSVRLRERS